MTQSQRLLAYLRDHPDASSMDIIRDLAIVNTTGRLSDLRAAGHDVRAWRDLRGVWRYRVAERPAQLTLGGAEQVLS